MLQLGAYERLEVAEYFCGDETRVGWKSLFAQGYDGYGRAHCHYRLDWLRFY